MYTDIFAFCYENSSHKLCRCANETMMIKHTHGLAQNIAKYTDRRQWKSPPTATHPHDFDVELMISTITSVNIHKKGFLPDSINIVLILNFVAWLNFLMELQLTHSHQKRKMSRWQPKEMMTCYVTFVDRIELWWMNFHCFENYYITCLF